jgi:guanyl-specific ribonuclease Sa
LQHVKQTGTHPPGFVGGRTFKNAEGRLPAGGKYREYDVDVKPPPGTRRNAERIVVDENTGRAWYTDDHYGSFTEIK